MIDRCAAVLLFVCKSGLSSFVNLALFNIQRLVVGGVPYQDKGKVASSWVRAGTTGSAVPKAQQQQAATSTSMRESAMRWVQSWCH
jgi:hypothetical protein